MLSFPLTPPPPNPIPTPDLHWLVEPTTAIPGMENVITTPSIASSTNFLWGTAFSDARNGKPAHISAGDIALVSAVWGSALAGRTEHGLLFVAASAWPLLCSASAEPACTPVMCTLGTRANGGPCVSSPPAPQPLLAQHPPWPPPFAHMQMANSYFVRTQHQLHIHVGAMTDMARTCLKSLSFPKQDAWVQPPTGSCTGPWSGGDMWSMWTQSLDNVSPHILDAVNNKVSWADKPHNTAVLVTVSSAWGVLETAAWLS